MKAAELALKISGVTQRGDDYVGLCPAHDDTNPSLTFKDGERAVLLKCFVGCSLGIICQAIGMKVTDLFFDATPPTNGQATSRPRVVATYRYRDEQRAVLYEVIRLEPKTFRQRRPNGQGGWIWNLKDTRRVLYRLPEVMAASIILVVEGERDVDTAYQLGLPEGWAATCNPMGAGKWIPAYTDSLADKIVVILPDADEPGLRHGNQVAVALRGKAMDISKLTLPDEAGKDLSEWAKGKTLADFMLLLDTASPWINPRASETERTADEEMPDGEGTADDALRMTDVGNGQRFAQQHHSYTRYCYPLKTWFVANEDALWERCLGDKVMQLAKATVLSMYDEARREMGDDQRRTLAAHAVKSESAQRLQAMIDLARSEPGIAIAPDAFDADPWLFSMANGVLDLKTGTLRERRRDDLITKQSPVVVDPTASCPLWMRFLEQIFQYNPCLITYVQCITGYCLTGLTVEQVFFLLWGSGSNGKSTLLKTLLVLFGDYGLQMPAETFLSRTQDGRATPDLARLQGARLAVAIESEEGCRLAEGTIKQMTGSDRIAARRLYQDFIEFDPTHKILFATNHKPRVRDNTHAMWRRMRLIAFEVQIADSVQDPQLANKLLAELPGIMNWALMGCLAWQQVGRLQTPETVVTATASYRTEQDVLDDFLGERCVSLPEGIVKFSELRRDYAEWSEDISERPLSSKGFASALQERGFQPTKIHNARHYCGLRLRTMSDDLADAQKVNQNGQSLKPDDAAGEPKLVNIQEGADVEFDD